MNRKIKEQKINTRHRATASPVTKKGFTLIEIMAAVAILSIVGISIFVVFQMGLRVVAEKKFKETAIALANQKIELVRNLSYNDVGTIGGVVAGNLLQSENITKNGVVYGVTTQVIYFDDPFDGTAGGSPDDLVSNDYKKVTITISWEDNFGVSDYILVTNVAPKGIETTVGGGTVRITVLNTSGTPIDQADVHIKNDVIDPVIDTTLQTNANGVLNIPGLQPSDASYKITVSKSGYSTTFTCGVDPLGNDCSATEGNPVPTDPHLSVIESTLTEKTFFIDIVSTLTLHTVSQILPTDWWINTDTSNEDQEIVAFDMCSNGNYVFVWHDERQSGNERIFTQQYDQAQLAQWNPDIDLSNSNNKNNPDVSVDVSCNAYFTWDEDKTGNKDIYFIKYSTAGVDVWSGSKKMNTQADSKDQVFPQVMVNASSTFEYIVWLDDRNDANDIFVQKVDPSGNVMWAQEVLINSDGIGSQQSLPRIISEKLIVDTNDVIYFTWHDNRVAGSNNIYLQKIDQTGTKLFGSDVLINTDPATTEQTQSSVALSTDGHLFIVWQDAKNGNDDIYLQKYSTAGTKIFTNDIRVDKDASSSAQQNPVITHDDATGDVYVAWQDMRNGDWDIYAQKIDSTTGAPLWTSDLIVNSTTTQDQQRPDILINNNGYLVVTWQDNSKGEWNIMAAQFNGAIVSEVDLGDIPFILNGAKTIGNNPILLKYSINGTTDTNGLFTNTQTEPDSYTITAGAGSTFHKIVPALPMNVLPNTNTTVKIFVTQP